MTPVQNEIRRRIVLMAERCEHHLFLASDRFDEHRAMPSRFSYRVAKAPLAKAHEYSDAAFRAAEQLIF